MTPQERAQKSAECMWEKDAASQGLGMKIVSVGPGEAVLLLSVRQDMLNGHGICHGGFIFTLADSAFAFACNSYNKLTVAQQNQITYVQAANLGEMLRASAQETSRTGRSGTYTVRVSGTDDRTIALFHGLSRTIKGQHFDEDDGA